MSIKNLVEMIKRKGLLASMPQLEELYQVAIENELKLAESQREFRAADATIENLQMQVEKLAAENAGLKEYLAPAGLAVEGTPATDAFLAEVRAQGAEECVRQLVTSDDDDFSDAPNVCAEVARQFRKGVQS
ncbi:hypothetical protein M8U73_18730 [Enterobacter hormaechei]|uniref:hypothetical protein n=1 Tax=Enterobacter hormaechei TaxID=158836 RepID=UPI001BE05FA2|nr:hypothetical protein [Enterobacter hormaechei]MBT1783436.1 hypothetical protein [Enterobacter hormaechei subsp. xiangfangensis]MCE1533976.1 hypothetical protein [Enterobacter hormaechei]MCM8322510.1 hypothetical protein [Enterobacter hormaechei]MCM8336375.1 hypothetical protein [Enterobacter hormaechei]MCM8340572.1 hypothetical protein [Enterobacter hormaechei]